MKTELDDLIGKKIINIFLNRAFLRFDTNQGSLTYQVDGDCCSYSYFYDFFGVGNLIGNGPVKSIESVELHPTDLIFSREFKNGEIRVYGFRIITDSKYYGEVSSVFSFRNSSNGYYGGSIRKVDNVEVSPEVVEDVSEVR